MPWPIRPAPITPILIPCILPPSDPIDHVPAKSVDGPPPDLVSASAAGRIDCDRTSDKEPARFDEAPKQRVPIREDISGLMAHGAGHDFRDVGEYLGHGV